MVYKVSVLTQCTLQHTHKGFKPTESSLSEENACVYVCVRLSIQKGFREENKIASSCHSDSPLGGRKGLRKGYVSLTEKLEWFIVAEQFNPDQSSLHI